MLVVTEMNIRYHQAAEFDDLLDLQTRLVEIRKVRLRHEYRITRGEELIVKALGCLTDAEGQPIRLPKAYFQPLM